MRVDDWTDEQLQEFKTRMRDWDDLPDRLAKLIDDAEEEQNWRKMVREFTDPKITITRVINR